jgi:hypothetical protein
MVLTKDEFIACIKEEVRILSHLVSKVEPGMLDYRPGSSQRSILEVLQYLTMFAPLHLRGVLAPSYDEPGWIAAYQAESAIAKTRSLDQIRESIASQADLAGELLGHYPDENFRQNFEMFGMNGTRGSWLIKMVIEHYAAYRMQLFIYLKSAGRAELNTMNLWAGIDGSMQPPPATQG